MCSRPGDIRRQMEAETPGGAGGAGGADAPKSKEKSPEEQIQAILHKSNIDTCFTSFCSMATRVTPLDKPLCFFFGWNYVDYV